MSFVTDSILKKALGKIKTWGEGKFVAQEAGKGLSTNDYTTAEKNKLSGIEAGANKYAHPTSHAATMITEDTTHRFVTDTEKSTWNAKAGTSVATKTANGLMAADDKTKLDAIASGAQVNKIESVKVNGTALSIDASKAVNVDLTAYAKSADVTKEIASAVSGVTQIDYSVVESLPSTGKKGIIYLVANSGSDNNIYDEYIYINSKFEKLGSRESDLSSYAKKTDIPTKVSSLTNDSGYQTAAQVTSAINAKLVAMTETELNSMWTEVFGA